MSNHKDIDAMVRGMQQGPPQGAQALAVAAPQNDMQLVAHMAAYLHAQQPQLTAQQCVDDAIELLVRSIATITTANLRDRVRAVQQERKAQALAVPGGN